MLNVNSRSAIACFSPCTINFARRTIVLNGKRPRVTATVVYFALRVDLTQWIRRAAERNYLRCGTGRLSPHASPSLASAHGARWYGLVSSTKVLSSIVGLRPAVAFCGMAAL